MRTGVVIGATVALFVAYTAMRGNFWRYVKTVTG